MILGSCGVQWCARALVVFEFTLGVLVFGGHRPSSSLSIYHSCLFCIVEIGLRATVVISFVALGLI